MAREMWGPDEYIDPTHTGALDAIGLPWLIDSDLRRGDPFLNGGRGGASSIFGNTVSSPQQCSSPTFYGGTVGRSLIHFHAAYRAILEEIVSIQNAVRFEWYRNNGINFEVGSVRFDGDANKIEIYTAHNVLRATSTGTLNQGQWYLIEVEVLIKNVGGFIKVWVDDGTLDKKTATPFVEFTGDTEPAAGDACTQVGMQVGRDARWDDFRVNSVTMAYDGGGGTFAPSVGDTITDGTTGATAVITAIEGDGTSGILVLQEWDGTAFGDNNTITESGGATTAAVNAPTADYVNGFEPNSGAIGGGVVVNLGWGGNGTTSQLTGSDADSVDNFLHTDDRLPEDAAYVEAATTGLYDTYAADDLPAGSLAVRAAQHWALAHTELLGIDDVQFATRLGGVDRFSDSISLPNSSGFVQKTLDTHPDGTTGAIEPDVIDAGEYGWKLV